MDLFSSFRKPKKTKPTDTIGEPGAVVVGGRVQDNEKSSQLIGTEKYRVYSDILSNVAIVSAGVRYYLNLVGKAKWSLKPADESPQAQEIADKIDVIINSMKTPWHRVVRRSAMYRFYGFSVQEWTANKNPETGDIGFLDIAPRPQITIDKWERDDNGCVKWIIQTSPSTFQELAIERSKVVYLVDDTLNDSPEGLGLFRHLVDSVQRLERYEQLEGFGFEIDLRGVPIGMAPMSELNELVEQGKITAVTRDKILEPMVNFINNHIKNPKLGLLLDSKTYESQDEAGKPSNANQWGIELLKGSNTSQETNAQAINRIVHDIARILGVQGLLLGSSSVGSNAMFVGFSHDLAMVVDGTNKEIAETLNDDVIKTLMRLNGWDMKLKPTFNPEPSRFRDIQEVTGALRDLAQAGAVLDPDDPVINEVREFLSVSDSTPFRDEDKDLSLNSDKETIESIAEQDIV